MVRELWVETAIEIDPDALTLVGEFDVYVPSIEPTDHLWFYAAPVDLSDDDIECHEGRQIVFVAAQDARKLPLAVAAEQALVPFLDSALYRGFASRPP